MDGAWFLLTTCRMRTIPTPKHSPLRSTFDFAPGESHSIESDRPEKTRLKFWLGSAAIALVVGVSSLAIAQIRNSVHDFSSSGQGGKWGSPTINEVCVFCHTPHKATSQTMIWNRTNPTATFNLYLKSADMAYAPGQPTDYSRRCLSCHDGSTAIDALNNVGGRQPVPSMMAIGDVYYPGSPYGSGAANIGGNYAGNSNVNDLSDDHPISITYDATTSATGRMRDPSLLTTAPALPLYASKVECSTCHEVHNSAGTQAKLLRDTINGSTLCLRCHIK
jgi:predicted CXXCH cytochrome family protein